MMETNVKAFLMYECETWKRTRNIGSYLEVYIRRCLRKILNI